MNAKLLVAAVLILAVETIIWPTFALSFDFPYIFSDPLRTTPDVINKGVILPGDSAPLPSSVQKDLSQPLTLSEAVDLALSNNQKIKSAWADIKIQAGTLGEAYAAYLPTVTGAINWTKDKIDYSNSKYTSTSTDGFTYDVSGTLRLLDFGGRTANRRASENLLAAALATHDATMQDALNEVIQNYFDAMTANASIKTKSINEQIAQDTLNSAKVREAKGVVSQSDTLRATTALARASLDKNRAYGDYQKTLAVLGRILGLPGSAQILLPKDMEQKDGTESKELALWLEEAQKIHPAIIAAKKQLEAAEQQVVVTKSAGLPTVNMSGSFYQNSSPGTALTATDTNEYTLTFKLTVPLFDGFASTYKLRGAQAQVEKKAAALVDTERQVAMGIIKAYADATSTLRNLESSATLLESAQSALTVSQRKYDKGAADITELLSTQAALADAWNERVRCLAEWNSARLRLLANAGKMGRFAVANAPKPIPDPAK